MSLWTCPSLGLVLGKEEIILDTGEKRRAVMLGHAALTVWTASSGKGIG